MKTTFTRLTALPLLYILFLIFLCPMSISTYFIFIAVASHLIFSALLLCCTFPRRRRVLSYGCGNDHRSTAGCDGRTSVLSTLPRLPPAMPAVWGPRSTPGAAAGTTLSARPQAASMCVHLCTSRSVHRRSRLTRENRELSSLHVFLVTSGCRPGSVAGCYRMALVTPAAP